MGKTSPLPPLMFVSADRRFGLRIEERFVRKLLNFCRSAGKLETGGIFVGTYNVEHDLATVTNLSGPPNDSQRGRYAFYRGVEGLQAWIDDLWGFKKHHYLGEWHFHPFSDPSPSSTDLAQLKKIARSPSYHCPEPILLIAGGDPKATWSSRAFVFPRKKEYVELFLIPQEII